MHLRQRNLFTTIRTEGSILPADLLERILAAPSLRSGGDRDPQLKGLSPEDYHLVGNVRLNEAINQSWNRLLGAWAVFQKALAALPATDTGTTLTREKWLLPLFSELGYGRLQTAKAIEIDGRSYPVSHAWQQTPIHLVSAKVKLDERTAGVAGAARISPHGMMQELLNRSEAHLWGFVSNGLQLRILRDNVSLTRQAYVEFDLEAMMNGELYADFTLLWLLCHQSRVEVREGERVESCWLEKWSKAAEEQGTRALEALRGGVEEAIKALGRSFLAHPANQVLLGRLRQGELDKQDYYRQLLRLVYRLLFLFVAEDRELLFTPSAEDKARERYTRFYSIARLRRLAERRLGTRHSDLFHGLRLVMRKLGDGGCSELGLPALGSFLFSNDAIADLDGCEIANNDLLDAVRALAFISDGHGRRTVDYKNLRSEELGSVYEALLELHPVINAEARQFNLERASGNERKTTGSYYTPDSLVQCLLDSALEPVVEAAIRGSREWGVGSSGKKNFSTQTGESADENRILQRPGSLAEGDEHCGDVLSGDAPLSQGGIVRDDITDPPGRRLGASERRGRVRQGINEGIPPLSKDRTGQFEGDRNASDPLYESRSMHGGESRPDSAAIRTTGPHASLADPQTGSAIGREVGSRQWAEGSGVEENPTPHSPLPTPSSAEQAILSLKICDPACGSGHFLIAAAHRMARRLAAVRTGDGEPAPEAVRKALRDVIGHSIYGVDMNPMAVELCKVSLWMEALEPGKPLSFLDHRIQCGNSLIGATPALMKKGIPDEAFKPIEGDDKTTCTEYKRYNKRYRESGQRNLFESEIKLGNLAASLLELEEIDDSTIQGVREKQRRWEQLVRSNDYIYGGLLADAWCAAFVWKKVEDRNHPYPITEELFRKIEQSPWHVARSHHETEIRRLAAQYQFFHWHLAFPDVFCLPSNAEQPENKLAGWNGGFDVVLGNPPWERIKLQEKEWFAQRRPEIANAPNAAARKRMIDDLAVSDEALYAAFKDDIRKAEGESHFVRNSGRYPLCGRGDINTYAIFAETNRMLMSERGRVGCIVPSGIATDDTTKFFFQELMESHTLASLYDFENRAGLFPAVDSRMKFCLLTMTGTQSPARQGAEFVFFAHKIEDLRDDDRCFTLSAEEIALLNPNTRTCPVFRIKRDAELTKAIYRRVPVLIREGAPDGNAWGIEFKRMIDMANDSGLFRTREDLLKAGWRLAGNVFVEKGSGELGVGSREEENAVPTPHSPLPTPSFLPLYEAKMLHHYDHRFGDYDDKPEDSQNTSLPDVPVERLQNPDYVVQPRYWVPRDEVIYKITRVPPDLLKAYRDGDEEKLRLAALQWLAAWDTARESEADWDGLNSKERQARRERRTRAREFLAAHPLTAAECHELRHGREELETTIARLIEAKAPRWLLGWRDITNSTNERTVIASALPRAGVGHTSPLMFTHQGATQVACLQANLTALVFDFVARQKIGGTHLTYGYLNQLPVLPPSTYSQPCSWFPSQTLREWIAPRVLELSYTAHDLRGFAEDCGYTGSGEWGVGNRAEEQIPTPHSPLPTPFKWDEARRFLLRCELDAAYFHLYGIAREDAAYILDTFPIVRRKDEAQHGEYRTKRVILEIYDEMRRAMETGAAYQTRLDPPPANGWTPPALQQEETSTTLEASSKKSVIEGQEDLFTWQSENPQQQLKFGDSD